MDIAERLSDYFERQIAHYKKLRDEHDTITRLLDAGDMDGAEAMSSAHARDSAQLEKEFTALLREWQADKPGQDAQSAVRSLARQAADLAHELEVIVNAAAGDVRERRNAVKREWEAIRRGQNVIVRYRTINTSEPDRIDRNI